MNEVTTRGKEDIDTFTRPANTDAYGAGDVIAATVSDTGTTPLRALNIAFGQGRAFWLNYLRVDTSKDDFAGTVQVHLYKVAAPSTAVPGDNTAFTRAYANVPQYLGSVLMPAFSDVGNYATAERDDVRLELFQSEHDAAVYYRIVLVSGTPTPASEQSFTVTARSSEN